MFVSLRNYTEADTSDGYNTSFDHDCTVDEHLESMFPKIANSNRFAGGVAFFEIDGSENVACYGSHGRPGNTEFTRAFSYCMAAFMTETKFEMKWHASINRFGLHGNAWIDRAIARLCHTEMKDGFKTLNEHSIIVTHLALYEKHAAELYIWGIFHLVHEEIKEEATLSICNFVENVESQAFTFKKWHGGNKT
ncbi:hypothetical protein ACOSP7_009859 [Xanthoceras sorbifolium]